ncbi:peptidoglycan binding domain-containing protein [Streptomyces otsuchiensis]|uniref:peptidoglycan binding domain-containing protein n=1 Tax=Streptomyces otsuchiensis TaxID=2681388 RepID=UPI0010313717|nr:peptidoglycan binding domain-containing protein [Streptomyces otsuchiensis]
MTTRIRINIPGSRPIPPVVMREPVQQDEAPGASPAPPKQPGAPAAESATSQGGPGTAERDAGKKPSSWFEPRKPLQPGATPPGGVPLQDTPAEGVPRADTPAGGTPRADTPPGGVPPLPKRDVGGGPSTASSPVFGGRGPAGPTSGPATGDMPLPPSTGRPPGTSMPMAPGAPQDIGNTTMDLGGPLPRSGNAEAADRWVRESQAGPPGGGQVGPAGSPVLTDPFPPSGRQPAGGPFGGAATPPPGPGPRDEDDTPAPAAARPAPAKKKKSKVKLAVVALGGVLALAYGAGLLLNQHEVPTGTTVLGNDIGGGSTQQAIAKLDTALAEPAQADMTLVVGGGEVPLKPSVAGLSIDTEATVRGASGTDYNPVSVIGSLFGGSREVEPVYSVDEEKLTAALADLAGDFGGAPTDGSVSLAGGVPEAVYGEPGAGVDVESAAPAVQEAFRQRAVSGDNVPVELETTTVDPAIDDAEVDRAMAEFAEPAMSGTVTVAAAPGGAAIQFSPENSLHRFISMEAVDGKLVDRYDLEELETLYGGTFVGVQVTRGDGSVTAVTPEDVVGALRQALLETEPEQRIGYLDLG